jgi:hypothetical protein
VIYDLSRQSPEKESMQFDAVATSIFPIDDTDGIAVSAVIIGSGMPLPLGQIFVVSLINETGESAPAQRERPHG